MYFKKFPKILYDFKQADGSTTTKVVSDITRNVRFRKEILENITVYDEYDIQDGETPEIIAEKVYGNPEYHWIVMLANQRWEYLEDFPLDETSLTACIESAYNPVLTADSWSYSGNTITAVIPNHGLKSASEHAIEFTVSGTTATTNAPNGTFVVGSQTGSSLTVVDLNTITFYVTNAPTGTAGGVMVITTKLREFYIAHYLDDRGFKVDSDYPGAVSITCDQMSRQDNEAKRRIKLISKEALTTILNNYRELM